MSDLINVTRETLINACESIRINMEEESVLNQIGEAAKLLKGSGNRIILTGMGKSGLIAKKIAATMTSTGSPAVFLHPADALHGDMGNIQKNEVVLSFSNSGETREIVELLPHIRYLGGELIAITQKSKSTLAKEADVAIIYSITKEGCPLNLAPMASTTVCLAIGDALSSALIHLKKFKPKDFGKFHPSGALGKRLLTKVSDVMKKNVKSFSVSKETSLKNLITIMVSSNMGAILVVGSKGHLRGIITDGDIKRLLDLNENEPNNLFRQTAEQIMKHDPVSITSEALIETAVSEMHNKKIYNIPVVNTQKKPIGLIRMHDAIEYI